MKYSVINFVKPAFPFRGVSMLSVLFLFCCWFATSQQKEEEGWTSMFNGSDLEGWTAKIQHYDVFDNYGDTFRVEDGILKVRYDQYEGLFNDRFGHLYYDQPYSYFHLSMEYRFVGELFPGSPDYTILNSGLMYHSQDPRTLLKEQDWPISVEMQFLAGLEPGNNRPTGNMCSPGTNVVYNGKLDATHCINSASDTYFGDQWVKAELIVYGDSLVRHIINGKTVLEYAKPQMGGENVKRYDPTLFKPGTPLKEGFIALQSEGQPIDFRNIKIRNLKGCMDPNALNYQSYYIEPDKESCEYN